ncbi:MAG: exopolyphosphatase, partial [Bacteroidota bacterium]|nr:exopolyphosphatase [Bacteroidota bacterium]
MKIIKYAAIDIGSNAVRVLISNILSKKNKPTIYVKSSIVRVPIRLGQDSFTVGEIS